MGSIFEDMPVTYAVEIDGHTLLTASGTAEGAKTNAMYWLAEHLGPQLVPRSTDIQQTVITCADDTANMARYHEGVHRGQTRLHGLANDTPVPESIKVAR